MKYLALAGAFGLGLATASQGYVPHSLFQRASVSCAAPMVTTQHTLATAHKVPAICEGPLITGHLLATTMVERQHHALHT